jgi:hypothetical protein
VLEREILQEKDDAKRIRERGGEREIVLEIDAKRVREREIVQEIDAERDR